MPKLAQQQLSTLLSQHEALCDVIRQLVAYIKARECSLEVTLFHIADSLLGLYERCAISASGMMVDELAWRARGIFELSLIAEFVCASGENKRRFEEDSELDELEMRERLAAIDQKAADYQSEPKIENRKLELQLRKESRGQKRSRPLEAFDIAQALGRQREYSELYKVYSKMAHPSAWLILGSTAPFSWDAMVKLLLLKANGHAADCVITLYSSTKFPLP